MTWKIEFERSAERELDRLEHEAAQRILRFLHKRVAPLKDPRAIGEALRGSAFAGLWKYRVGDYRIIANIEDKAIRIIILRIRNRREIYR